MNDGLLSQEEINALLNGNADTNSKEMPTLNESEKDLLGEVGNISMGSASTALSTLTNSLVNITTPRVSVTTLDEIRTTFEVPNVVLEVEYTEGLDGVNVLLIKITDAAVIADLMMGGDGSRQVEELSEIEISAVSEAMNQMVGSASTSLATMLGMTTNISPPHAMMWDDKNVSLSNNVAGDDAMVRISFRMTINDLVDSEIMMLLGMDTSRSIINKMTGGMSMEDEPADTSDDFGFGGVPITSSHEPMIGFDETPVSPVFEQPQTMQTPVQQPVYQQQPMQEQYQQPVQQYAPQPMQQPVYQQQPMYQQPMQYAQQPPVNVQRAEFAPLAVLSPHEKQNIDLILDVPLEISVVLGRTKKTIKEILELGAGSLVELEKMTEEPVEILVNGKKVAMGEVVVIDENFGVRITSIISNVERVKSLQAK